MLKQSFMSFLDVMSYKKYVCDCSSDVPHDDDGDELLAESFPSEFITSSHLNSGLRLKEEKSFIISPRS